jgi:hypothetical protein
VTRYRLDEEPEPEVEPDDDDEWFSELPHAGLWSRRGNEDVMRCATHDLRPDDH